MPVVTSFPRWPARALVALALVAGMLAGLAATTGAPAAADPQATPGQGATPGAAGDADATGGPDAEPMIGAPGTHVAHDDYGYAFPEAPDCDESPAGNGGCVADDRGFYQGQCTSWVAHRLSTRNAISFSNWYGGLHWGDAADWNKASKALGHKPDRIPAVGAVAWFRRGHVAYVEAVNTDGSIVISEMNYDGHNGFRLATVYPGYGWPDRFLHLADVVPVDTVAPTTPGGLDAVAHRGRTGLSWRPSGDAFGVVGYRVLRDGYPLGSTTGTTWWDRRVSADQTYRYSVVALDEAGNASAPATLRVLPGSEAADRAWVPTSRGPALCGRAGTEARPRLGCTVLTDRGWRRTELAGDAAWGSPDTRRFVSAADGSVSYCRAVGAGRRAALACTRLDPRTLHWGYDRISTHAPQLVGPDRAWLATPAGPARCGLSGSERHQRLTCSVLTSAGWRVSRLDRDTRWGDAASRTFLASPDGRVSFCRTVGTGRPRLACTPFDPVARTWGYDRISNPVRDDRAANAQWVAAGSGPVWCTGAASGHPACRVLDRAGWHAVAIQHDRGAGDPLSRAFIPTPQGGVAWCRTIGDPDLAFRAACSTLDTRHLRWRKDLRSEELRSTEVDNRTWLSTAAGPALCGRTGREAAPGVGCAVLTDRGWRTSTARRHVGWGVATLRAFVPTPEGVAWCRTGHAGAVTCNRLVGPAGPGRAAWSRDRTAWPLKTYADVL